MEKQRCACGNGFLECLVVDLITDRIIRPAGEPLHLHFLHRQSLIGWRAIKRAIDGRKSNGSIADVADGAADHVEPTHQTWQWHNISRGDLPLVMPFQPRADRLR